MPPTVKENGILSARPEAAQRPAPTTTPTSDAAIKQQAVALEVPVTVNGARAVEGSDKREPFAETTKTVLIFGNGAVIRLSSSVAPGQLLFLTNEKTKKEVVCQVVKSKNYRNVSGYVELEFTESVVGFWGMRFPGDRIGSVPQPVAPVPAALSTPLASGSLAIPRPTAPKVEAQRTNVSASVIAPKPVVPISVAKSAEPKLAEVPKAEELLPQRPVAPVTPLSSALSTSFDPEASLKLASAEQFAPVVPEVPVAPVSTIPEVPVISAPPQPVESEPVLSDSPRASEAQASFLEPAKTPTAPLTNPLSNLLSLFEAKPADPPAEPAPAVQVCVDVETETLKQHTARLQEQLSNMMFSGEPKPPETVSVQIPHASPVVIQKELAENAAKILQVSQISTPEPVPAKPVAPVKLDPLPTKSSLQDEELKIPSWLEPLARNAAAPSSTHDLIEREKAKRLAEQQPKTEEIAAEVATAVEEPFIPELPLPTFGDSLPLDEVKNTRESGSKRSGHGMQLAAFAAAVLAIAVGAWWYITQPFGSANASAESASTAQASVVSSPVESSHSQSPRNAPAPANISAQTNPASLTNTAAPSNSASKTLSVVPASGSVAAASRNPQPSSNPANSAAAPPPAPVVAAAEQPKKPVLGNAGLATPKVTAKRGTQNSGELDAGPVFNNEDQPDSNAEGLNAGLAGGNAQPSAPVTPLPVGGDVKQAKLISSVPPIYPALARNQHISGNVQIDALIDANGRVTTMKVVSGPTLLQQAAMDALKQWKYQPAMLDGKPVAMHLTVTLQFRLQ